MSETRTSPPRFRVFARRASIGLVLLFVVAGYYSRTVITAWWNDRPVVHRVPPGMADDASWQNATPVREVWPIPNDPEIAQSQLAALLKRASEEHLKISIAGARHSMGGHTITQDGIVIDMLPFKRLSLNSKTGVLTAGAGARWSDILPYLDARGFSVGVMQAYNDFTVGGSVSVNCHGWQHNHAPIASTVQSLRLMRADSSIVKCSLTENSELFSHVLGGYGLFGIILDVELRVVPNEMFLPETHPISVDQYVSCFREQVDQRDDVGMVYGRLCVVPGEETFLKESILTLFRKTSIPLVSLESHPTPEREPLKREVFRSQIGSLDGKELRWNLEKKLGEQAGRRYVSRNFLLDSSASIFQEQNAGYVDILQEYFIPPDQVEPFLVKARDIIPRHAGELLNVTIRNVREDQITALRYAPGERFAFVCLFHQKLDVESDRRMAEMTRELISAAIDVGGSYYLPYRLHAGFDQFEAVYPHSQDFFEFKRKSDPDELFSNAFYERYGKVY